MSKYWVGEFKQDGSKLVFDRNMQDVGSSVVYLFVVEKYAMVRFEPSKLKPHVSAAKNKSDCQAAIHYYESWKKIYGKSFARKILPKSILKRTKPREYKSRSKRVRQTHCFDCGHPLSSRMDKLCSACDWVVCPRCDTCGCLWRKFK